jgi:GTPase
MPLGEGVLAVNLGIPIIVVINKVDLILQGEKVALLEKNIEFIWKHVR